MKQHLIFIWRNHPRILKLRYQWKQRQLEALDRKTTHTHNELRAQLAANLLKRSDAGLPMPKQENRYAVPATTRYSGSRYSR
jgi:hypothetical protein